MSKSRKSAALLLNWNLDTSLTVFLDSEIASLKCAHYFPYCCLLLLKKNKNKIYAWVALRSKENRLLGSTFFSAWLGSFKQ
ncbi:hypothetical protein FKM82_022595 [Ascaphus truei]